ncbi:MAG: hypothetical protein LCH88_09220 [Proteobacteria bacterium]|nr:hypothetical protein [Pseudomonadota bacterium]
MAEKKDGGEGDGKPAASLKINKEINVWSIGTTLFAAGAMFAYFQADIRALQTEDMRHQRELLRVEAAHARRLDQMDADSRKDRESLLTMQGDIRVIRHIVEGVARPPPR